ncbi:MAG: O-antigen ligase family protein [Clostridia bacterium]|nr:O-antigen ligase family protein [Clostridia bacterium]
MILPFFYHIAVCFYHSVQESFIGRFFTGYDRDNHALNNGLTAAFRRLVPFGGKHFRSFRFTIAAQFDHSILLNAIRKYLRHLAAMSLPTYGLCCLFFSLFSSISYVICFLFSEHWFRSSSYTDLILSAAFLFIGICLIGSRTYLSAALCQSKIASFLLFSVAGAKEEYFRALRPVRGQTMVASLIGAVLGIFTLAIPPIFLPIAVLGFIMALLFYKIPEFGVISILFLAPFLPTMLLVVLMMYLILCFLVKYLRGKRTLTFGWIDVCVLLFMCIFFFAGIFSAKPSASLPPILVFTCFMCGYFLVVNLIRSKEWIHRAVFSVLSSAVIVSLYGIYQNFFTTVNSQWQDTSMFSDISGRVVSTLENPNVLAEYLIMVLPITVALFFCVRKFSQKLLCLFVGGTLGACLIFTWSRGAWLGLMLALMIFLLMYSKKVMVCGLFGILAIPFLPFVLPESILNRFLSIGNLLDTSTSYRVHIWEGTINMLHDHFIGGIGVGVDVFQTVYPPYALSGIEQAPHSHNLYLQILVETGILGLLVFLVFLIVFAKLHFSYYIKPFPSPRKYLAASLFCGILAVLAQGMTDYIWYNYRVFLVFWLLLALSIAVYRVTESENRPKILKNHAMLGGTNSATLDIPCQGQTYSTYTERKDS